MRVHVRHRRTVDGGWQCNVSTVGWPQLSMHGHAALSDFRLPCFLQSASLLSELPVPAIYDDMHTTCSPCALHTLVQSYHRVLSRQTLRAPRHMCTHSIALAMHTQHATRKSTAQRSPLAARKNTAHRTPHTVYVRRSHTHECTKRTNTRCT
jgi:hypothetical protein